MFFSRPYFAIAAIVSPPPASEKAFDAAIARAIAASKAFSLAGGGDTIAAIAKYGLEKNISYISTGGGAFLEFLEGRTLPAVAALAARADA